MPKKVKNTHERVTTQYPSLLNEKSQHMMYKIKIVANKNNLLHPKLLAQTKQVKNLKQKIKFVLKKYTLYH